MNRHVNVTAGRLSLRALQRRSLEILDRVTEIVPLKKGIDLNAALAAIRGEYPTVADFEREFPSLCFALGAPSSVTCIWRMASGTSSCWRPT